MSEWAKKYGSVSAIEGGRDSLAGAKGVGRARAADPVAAILGDEPRGGFDWFYAGLAVALLMHAGMLGFAVASHYLHEIRTLMQGTRVALHEYFWTQYDVDLTPKDKPKAEPPKPEEPPPEPEAPPPPAPKAAPKPKDDPYDQPPPPPTPAKAAAVLTQKEDPDKVEDLTGNTVVTGDGTATHGQQSASGTGDKPVLSPHASLSGVPGGKGTGSAPPPPPPPPPAVDRSKSATPLGSTSWNCPFPPEADADQIDRALVNIVVTVRPDGTPVSVNVVSDPGNGFGRAARMCALSRRYTPALDRNGTPITAATPPIRVLFTR
jgi:periplasmic protein TonB